MGNDECDPDAPRNIAAAGAAQAIATAQAPASEGDTLPLPPDGLPALRSIPSRGIEGAAVLGYVVNARTVRDCIAPDGRRTVPGDPGFLEAQHGRLGVAPMPAGWMFEESRAAKIARADRRQSDTAKSAGKGPRLFACDRDRPAVA